MSYGSLNKTSRGQCDITGGPLQEISGKFKAFWYYSQVFSVHGQEFCLKANFLVNIYSSTNTSFPLFPGIVFCLESSA